MCNFQYPELISSSGPRGTHDYSGTGGTSTPKDCTDLHAAPGLLVLKANKRTMSTADQSACQWSKEARMGSERHVATDMLEQFPTDCATPASNIESSGSDQHLEEF